MSAEPRTLAELIGTLERLDDNGRIAVLLDMMGGRVLLQLPRAFVGG